MVDVHGGLNYGHTTTDPLLFPLSNVALALQECRQSKNSIHAKRLHLDICHHGLETHERFGNYLVPMLSECGCLQDAQNALNKLTLRNEHSWTALIQGYLDSEEPEMAFFLYPRMQEDCVLPSAYTFVPLLKSCSMLGCIERGHWLHSEIIRGGFDNDLVLGNSLIDLYVKHHKLEEAHTVFQLLTHQDVISFNTLISGYVDNDNCKEAHCLYTEMLLMHNDVQADACTFVCMLSLCTATRGIHLGQEIYGEIVKEGYEQYSSVGSKLVDFYAQSGFFEEAEEVFDQLLEKDEVTWTALISGYAEHGFTEKALTFYENMLSAGMVHDSVTLVSVVKACGFPDAIDEGLKVHSQILKQQTCCESFLGNSLICMYARCGSLLDSKKQFDMLHQRDVVSWTALITGYADHGCINEALENLEMMQREGVAPNAATYSCIMQGCCNTGTLSKGQKVFSEIVMKGLETDTGICNLILGLYISLGLLEETQVVFDMFAAANISSWNLLIAGFAECGLGEEVFACLEHMEEVVALSPTSSTYSCCLNFCATVSDIEKGLILHSETLKKGFEKELCVGTALVELYAKCNLLAELESVFDNYCERDVAVWNALMHAYVNHSLYEKALCCLEHMYTEGVIPNIVSWNILVLAFIEVEESIKSLELFLLMQAHSLCPDGVMLMSALKACGEMSALEFGKRIHAQSCCMMGGEDSELSNTLIHMYGNCGHMSLAQEVFDSMNSKLLVTWNALIAGYARHGASSILSLNFDKMLASCIEPDEVTFLSVLTACTHEGELNKGQEWFETMVLKTRLSPNVKHYTCMLDMFGRAGHLDEIMAIVNNIPLNLDVAVWEAVLGLRQKQGNEPIGLPASNTLTRLYDRDSAALL